MNTRETIETLKLQGLNNREIAAKLGMSPSTITYHLKKDYRKRHYENTKKRRSDSKLKAIEYKGRKCQICGYDKCMAAMEFHHTDPTKKDPKLLTGMRLVVWSWDKMVNELDKCILLCCRCHRELHSELDSKSNPHT